MRDTPEPARPNMTPMIDVVFQLIVFFLVSMKFKTLDMKLDAHLPDPGIAPDPSPPPPPPTLDVRLRRASAGAPTEIRVGGMSLGDVRDDGRRDDGAGDDGAWARFRKHAVGVLARQAESGGDPARVHAEVDASPSVRTALVVRALDTLHDVGFADVRFTGTLRADAPPR